jgi:hypothetical protein
VVIDKLDLGYQMAVASYPWQNYLPGFLASSENINYELNEKALQAV